MEVEAEPVAMKTVLQAKTEAIEIYRFHRFLSFFLSLDIIFEIKPDLKPCRTSGEWKRKVSQPRSLIVIVFFLLKSIHYHVIPTVCHTTK